MCTSWAFSCNTMGCKYSITYKCRTISHIKCHDDSILILFLFRQMSISFFRKAFKTYSTFKYLHDKDVTLIGLWPEQLSLHMNRFGRCIWSRRGPSKIIEHCLKTFSFLIAWWTSCFSSFKEFPIALNVRLNRIGNSWQWSWFVSRFCWWHTSYSSCPGLFPVVVLSAFGKQNWDGGRGEDCDRPGDKTQVTL